MAQREVLVLFFLALLCKAIAIRSQPRTIDASFCLSWRLAVETNNELPWRTVPNKCSQYVEDYLIHGQYERDLELIMEQALDYVNGISIVGDGKDAWILDVDDTCISNIYYYKSKNYGYVFYHNHYLIMCVWLLMSLVPILLNYKKKRNLCWVIWMEVSRMKKSYLSLIRVVLQSNLLFDTKIVVFSQRCRGEYVFVFMVELVRWCDIVYALDAMLFILYNMFERSNWVF